MNRLIRILEQGFVTLALLLFSGGLLPLLGVGGDQIEGNPKTQAVWFGIYLITLPIAVAGWKSIVRTATRDRLLLALVGIALASVLWSGEPQVTLRRSIALIFTTLFGIFLAARFSLKEQLRLLTWALGIGAVLSLLFSLATAGPWVGVYAQKNVLGRNMDIAAVIFLINARSGRGVRWIAWVGFALAVGLVLMSTSKTALVTLVALIALWPLFRALQRHYTWAVAILIHVILITAVVAILLLDNTATLLEALGKDATLSGRTDLWSALLHMIKQQPWLGYGYGAFWLGNKGPSVDVWRVMVWQPNHAHNGFFDLWVELGSIGLSLFVLGLVRGFFRAATWLRFVKTPEGSWPLMYLSALLLTNLTLNTIIVQNNLFWILYVTIVLSSSAELKQVSQSSYIDPTLNKEKLLKNT